MSWIEAVENGLANNKGYEREKSNIPRAIYRGV